jgi:hypothetical protein
VSGIGYCYQFRRDTHLGPQLEGGHRIGCTAVVDGYFKYQQSVAANNARLVCEQIDAHILGRCAEVQKAHPDSKQPLPQIIAHGRKLSGSSPTGKNGATR